MSLSQLVSGPSSLNLPSRGTQPFIPPGFRNYAIPVGTLPQQVNPFTMDDLSESPSSSPRGISIPRIPVPRRPLSNEDVRDIHRTNRHFNIPEEGLTIPAEVIIPLLNIPKPNIIQFGTSIGMAMPPSYTRQALVNRIEENLRGLGYERDPDRPNTYVRDRPISLQLRGIPRQDRTPVREEDIRLPEVINNDIFNTIGSMNQFISINGLRRMIRSGGGRLKNDIARDIKDLLVQQGYALDQRGNYIKRGGAIITGGLEFNDLINTQEYIRFLQTVTQVQINQSDLTRLNTTLNNLLSNLEKRRWDSLDTFVKETSLLLSVPAPVVWLASLLIKLPHENNQTYIAILKAVNDVRPHRRMEDRLIALYGYFRQKIQPVPVTYTRKESFKGPALTTMTLEEALRGGYIIDEKQYEEQIDELLNRSQVPSNQREFFVKLIQLYPDMFDIMRTYGNHSTSFAHVLVRLYYTEVPSMVQELYTFAVNYPHIFPESPEKMARRQQITALPKQYLDSLYQIYSTRDLEVILDKPQQPLELYLTAISKVKAEQLSSLVANFGMVIPEHLLTRTRRQYVLQFIHEYRDIITRPADTPAINQIISTQPENVIDFIDALRKYTDQEITTFFGYLGGFENRNTLIEQIFRTISEEGFMVYKEINPSAATNAQTTFLTDMKDLIPPYLVFGTPFSYRVLELDELIHGFYEEKINYQEITTFRFTKIGSMEEKEETYNITQVSRLQTLLPAMRNMNPQLSTLVDQLLEKIRSGIIRTMKRNREVDALIRDVKQTPLKVQNIIKEIFYKIFYAGMYMRRWKGPGTQYPMEAASTRGGSDPKPKAIFTLGQILELMNDLRMIDPKLKERVRAVPEIDYNTGADTIMIHSHIFIFNMIDSVIKESKCIRQASRPFVLTASYFISVMFGEVIPDFDPHSVDAVS